MTRVLLAVVPARPPRKSTARLDRLRAPPRSSGVADHRTLHSPLGATDATLRTPSALDMRRRIQSESEEEVEEEEEIEVEESVEEVIEQDLYVESASPSPRARPRRLKDVVRSTRNTRSSTAVRSTRTSTARSSTRAPSVAGPSSDPSNVRKGPVVVEIPFMPFTELKRYTYASGLKAPTIITRSRTIAAQAGKNPAADRSVSKGKGRAPQRSAQATKKDALVEYGGYVEDEKSPAATSLKGKERETKSSVRTMRINAARRAEGEDDDAAFSVGPSSTSPSETNYDSDDSLLTRRMRPRVYEPKRTRAQVSLV